MSESLVAIVTGGAQGLGASIAKALLKRGYKVCVADIQEEEGKQLVEELQKLHGEKNVVFATCDVTEEVDYKNIFEVALRKFQRIDLVVNNAGILDELNPRRAIDVNLMGPILGCQLAIQYMGKSKGGKGGMVINTASIGGFLPYYPIPAYIASKHGVIGLTRSYGLPYHLEKEGIIFAALCPHGTDTPIVEQLKTKTLDPNADVAPPALMNPDYVAEGVLKLLDDHINGSTLLVSKSGGFQYVGLQEIFNDFKP